VERNQFEQLGILGLPIHMVQIPDVVRMMAQWAKGDRSRVRWIVVADMHAVVESHNQPEFRAMLETADLRVPDGIGLVHVARLKGIPLKSRVAGTDLMRAFFRETAGEGPRHYFYGDTDQTLHHLGRNLQAEFPGVTIAGCYSPPFRPLTQEEDDVVIQRINEAKPDVLWVGLGLPKQEQWIFNHRHRLKVPLVLGVGAAFKFLAGTVKRAPQWVCDLGFEWLWRFAREPRRLWKRIMIEGPQFVGHVALELAGLRQYR
jgi:N-acetylglucosaminyldiphosphoundecaprenol N-acetyl-beta-D-mannosaminyltransferase